MEEFIRYCSRTQDVSGEFSPAKPSDNYHGVKIAGFVGAMTMLGKGPLSNKIEMIALLKEPSQLVFTIGSQVFTKDAEADLSVFNIPAQQGQPIYKILRQDKTVIQVDSRFTIQKSGEVPNVFYYGGSSYRSAQ